MSLQYTKKETDRNLETTDQLVIFVDCKTMERLINGKIITHLEGNNLIGARLSTWLQKTGQRGNKAVDLIFLDFQKAFDKVPHERLHVKVMAHGIQGSAAQWIRNWLAGRRQRVCIDQTFSSWTQDTSDIRCTTR